MEGPDAQAFLRWWSGVRRRTRAVAEAIPEEHLEHEPATGRFSPGDLVRHIAAAERWMWGENVLQRPSRYPGHSPELATGRSEVLAYLERLQDETAAIVEGLSPDDLRRPCATVGGVEIAAWKWLRLMVEHEIHHRGQLYQVLGQLGAPTPPLYGLTETEVRARSQPG